MEEPAGPPETTSSYFRPIVATVGFHHAKGPETEEWFGVDEVEKEFLDKQWPLLPFVALCDGAHTHTEDFSYFTLKHQPAAEQQPISLFGLSCTRQLKAVELHERPADVTRSTVQKAVVVISDNPECYARLREKLSIITAAWFDQRDFTDTELITQFQGSLQTSLQPDPLDRDQYLGLSLRELIHDFRHQTLVLFKCCLLQPKMLVFGSRCERVCLAQFALISLIPNLIRNLQDCADPEMANHEKKLIRSDSLRTSDRASLLLYMGLPLQIFGKGSLFSPYTPLQQLDVLSDYGTKSYLCGSTNNLLLLQRDRYADILVNLDEMNISVLSSSLRSVLFLTAADRRWIDLITEAVDETWDPVVPNRPTDHGYRGSEEYIRLAFEEYLLAFLSATKYHIWLETHKHDQKALLSDIEGDPSNDFGSDMIDGFMGTENFRMFNKYTESHIFDIIEPKHPGAGNLSFQDIQRRLNHQIKDWSLDEKWAVGRETLGKHMATGQKKVTAAVNSLWSDIEALRIAQRKKAEDRSVGPKDGSVKASASDAAGSRLPKAPDLAEARKQVEAASQKAGVYLSSWATWAGEKRKSGWTGSGPGTNAPAVAPPPKPEKPPPGPD